MTKVKTYKICLLTEKGPITVIYKDDKPIAELENKILAKYGQFTILSAKEIFNSDTRSDDQRLMDFYTPC